MRFIHEEEAAVVQLDSFLYDVSGPRLDTFRSSDQNAIYAGDEWGDRGTAYLLQQFWG
jgi:hypothetical protein